MLFLVDGCCECDKVVTYVVDKYARVRVRVRAVGKNVVYKRKVVVVYPGSSCDSVEVAISQY
jgi:hypothetical protein